MARNLASNQLTRIERILHLAACKGEQHIMRSSLHSAAPNEWNSLQATTLKLEFEERTVYWQMETLSTRSASGVDSFCKCSKLSGLNVHKRLSLSEVHNSLITNQETSKHHLNKGKYDEAFGLLEALYELGPDVQFVTILMKSYVTALATHRLEKAEKIKGEIVSLIVEKFKVDPEDVCAYAIKLFTQEKFLQAFLFSQLCFSMLTDKSDALTMNQVLIKVIGCVSGSTVELVERNIISKLSVKKHFLPQLYKMNKVLEEQTWLEPKQKYTHIAMSLGCISEFEVQYNDEEKGVVFLKKAIDVMQKGLGKEAVHQEIYRVTLGKLAKIHLAKGRFREAAKALSDVIDATKTANDIESPFKKRQEIEMLENVLLYVRMQINS